MERVSKSHEDYLEAIVMIGGTEEKSVRLVDIANHLDVSKASVSKAISTLKESGLVVQPYYGDITLTTEGYEYGKSILDRHSMLFKFMTQVLEIPEETAAEEACVMEHAICEDSFKKWASFLKAQGVTFE